MGAGASRRPIRPLEQAALYCSPFTDPLNQEASESIFEIGNDEIVGIRADNFQREDTDNRDILHRCRHFTVSDCVMSMEKAEKDCKQEKFWCFAERPRGFHLETRLPIVFY